MRSNKFYIHNEDVWYRKCLIYLNRKHPYFSAFHGGGNYNESFKKVLFASNQIIELNSLDELSGVVNETRSYAFSLSFDLKNTIEKLETTHLPSYPCANISLVINDIEIHFEKNQMKIKSYTNLSPEKIFKDIKDTKIRIQNFSKPNFLANTTKEEYKRTVDNVKQHIIEGDVYEMCYCIAYEAKKDEIDPMQLFLNQIRNNPVPFASYYKNKTIALVSGSPERFLKVKDKIIKSQPIKGTLKRTGSNEYDEKKQLLTSEKDRSENLMIVDLVRNDLSKVSKTGSVIVEELFGIYSFPTLHQMISTVSGELKEEVSWSEILKSTFPMGSMTGAPKIMALKLIDRYENFSRQLYSGSTGYFGSGELDSNVVIRSVIIDSNTIRYHIGSAITYESIAEKEYDECQLKSEALLGLFSD